MATASASIRRARPLLGTFVEVEVAPGSRVVAIDNVKLNAFEYVDVGTPVEKTNVVPLIHERKIREKLKQGAGPEAHG